MAASDVRPLGRADIAGYAVMSTVLVAPEMLEVLSTVPTSVDVDEALSAMLSAEAGRADSLPLWW